MSEFAPAAQARRTEWVGEGTLTKQRGRNRSAPAYSGKLIVNRREYQLNCWWIYDGAGYRCLAFKRSTTRDGVLWPARDRISEDVADFFGVLRRDGFEFRLRAWRDAETDAINVRVKP